MQTVRISTGSRTETVNITPQVRQQVASSEVREGLCTVFVPHTTAGVTINEAADPDVQEDMVRELNTVIPFEDSYAHGEGNSAAHIKTSLFGSSVTIPISGGRLALGTWQGVFLGEFDGPRTRSVHIQIIGSP